MEMLSSLRGDKQELCLGVIKYKHVHYCPSFDITLHDGMELSGSYISSGGADICDNKSSANELCVTACVDNGRQRLIIHVEKHRAKNGSLRST